MDELENRPFLEWLESVLRDIVTEKPKSVSIEVVDEEGNVATRYFNTNRGDRALMMAAMQEAQIMDTICDYRDEIVEILNAEEDECEGEEVGCE